MLILNVSTVLMMVAASYAAGVLTGPFVTWAWRRYWRRRKTPN